jgi:hypothetical protein
VARRVSDPRQVDWIAAKRMLRYRKGTGSCQLKFPAGEVEVSTIADADYATSVDRKSISGNVLMIGNNAVVGWTSQKQKAVALSTAEAEYIACRKLCGRLFGCETFLAIWDFLRRRQHQSIKTIRLP